MCCWFCFFCVFVVWIISPVLHTLYQITSNFLLVDTVLWRKILSIDQINSTVTPNWYWIYYAQYWKFKQQCVHGLQETQSVRHNILIAFFFTHITSHWINCNCNCNGFRIFINTEGALRLPTTYDHPIQPIPSHPVWYKALNELNRPKIDLCRPSMTSNDYQWLPMTTNDYQWLPMTTDDYRWLQMTTHDYQWLPMTINDYQWLSMTTNDFQWLQMTTYDYQWLPMTTNDYPAMTTNDYKWLPMTTNDYQWLSMTSNDWLTDFFQPIGSSFALGCQF